MPAVEHNGGIEPAISDARIPGYTPHTDLVCSPPMEEAAACDHDRIDAPMREPDTTIAAAPVERHESSAFEPRVGVTTGGTPQKH
jgi:hypothetical protein